MVVPLFERFAPPRLVRAYQRAAMARFRFSAGLMPGFAVIETTGRRSGLPRQTPVGGRMKGSVYWLVAGNSRSQYIRNIEADPHVRVRVHGKWHSGTALICHDDNPRRRLFRLNPVNSFFIWLAGKDLLTVRVDLSD